MDRQGKRVASDVIAELADARAQQAAVDEILRVMADAPADVTVVLNAIAKEAAQLCRAPFARVTVVQDGVLRPLAGYAQDGTPRPTPMDVPFSRTSIQGRALVERRTLHFADIGPLLAEEFPDARENARVMGFRAVLAVPLLRGDEGLGAMFLYRREPGLFSSDQVALVETFARQAAIALHNVQQFRATREALEQQTATSEILRVISRSPTSVQPVFDTIAQSSLTLCQASSSVVVTLEDGLLHIRGLASTTREGAEALRAIFPRPPSRDNGATRAVFASEVIVIPDILEDTEYGTTEMALMSGFRSVLAVPLVRDGDTIGAISLGREVPGPFPASHVALLQTFAAQAVIALENVRLFTELGKRNQALCDALEQRTATSDILGVISRSPTDVQPVFDTIAENALRLCEGIFSAVYRFDGELIHVGALRNISPEGDTAFQRAYPCAPNRNGTTQRAVLTGRMVHMPDIRLDAEYGYHDVAEAAGFRSVLCIPMLHDGATIGAITVYRAVAGRFPEEKIALLRTFADQAVIAVQNVRLFNELNARNRDLTEALEQQTATSDILRVISQSQTDVQPVFDTIVRSVLSLCDASFSGVYLVEAGTLGLAATAGMSPADSAAFGQGYPRTLGADTVSGRAALECRVVQTADLMNDPDYAGAPGTVVGARTVLGVPLVRDGRAIGSIGVWRSEVKVFSETQISLLQTFADQAVIAIENVRLFNELNARTGQLTRSVGELRALGEVGQAVSSTLDVETVLGTIVTRVTKLTGMDGGSVYEYDEGREEFHLHSANGLPADVVEALRAAPIRKGEGALGRLATTGEAVEIRDVADERVYQSRVRDALVRIGYRSMLVVPLLREDHLLGGLVVNRKAPGAFDPRVLELMKTFATQSAIAIQNARLFREIEVKSRELEAASRHKSEFLANMSHELRTPLNAIIGFSEVLIERLFGDLNDKQAEYAADIADSGRHLLSLINDILDLSKIEAGRMELDVADVDLPKAIAQTLSLVRERAERRRIALSSSIEGGVGTIRADARKVKQVLLNLLSNALKFTPEGGAVDVRAAAFADRVEVSVTDNGVGIAPEEQEAVFEEFRQVGASASRVEGTGLGLAISRKFIELHGGRMWLSSTPGQGSVFTFSIPSTGP